MDGLLFGSRGAIPSFTWNHLKEFKFTASWLHNVVIDIIKDSLKIYTIIYISLQEHKFMISFSMYCTFVLSPFLNLLIVSWIH